MSENSVNGIVVDKISLNAMNAAFMRKLENFDCAIVLDQQGNDKNGKAQLAVLNTVTQTPKPSILLITTERLLYSWYQTMLCGIGADFKFITADPKSINYFSPKISNFYITHCGAAENPVFEKIRQSGLVWDLVIIDGGLASDGIDTDHILKGFDFKTKKLAVFAPYIRSASGEAEKLSQLPAKFLADKAKADYFLSNTPGLSTTAFSLSNPFMQRFTEYDTKIPNVKIINYTLNDEVLKAKQEQSTLSLYTYGGNIFEELTLDMRKLYNNSKYDDHIVNALREFDTKLDAYVNEVEALLGDPDTRIITYFSSEKTLNYVYKVLSSSVIGLKKVIAIKNSKSYNINDSRRNFNGDKTDDIRVILSLDDQIEQYDQVDNITHVFSFELPNDPMILNRRFRQGGRQGFTDPQFVLFRDDKDLFDGRMLCKTLALGIADCYAYNIPSRNIYLFTEKLDGILSEMILELEGVEGYSADKLNRLGAKYNIRESTDKVKEILCRKRDRIKTAFGISEKITAKTAAKKILTPKIEELKKGCCYFEANGALAAGEYNTENDSEYVKMSSELGGLSSVLELNKAREALKACDTPHKLWELLHNVEETNKAYVFYCAWRYMNENCGYKKDYCEFLRDVFEEVV
ncbi:MAG: hypothetical protein HDT44_04210 [Ruminococcaceae bacterium]|nr:hypothetical protein [Oscillospiraceae bacterium]